MIRKQSLAVKGKLGGKMLHEPLTNQGRSNPATAFALQGCHGRLILAAPANPVKRFQARVDIQMQSKGSDPITHSHPGGGNQPGTNPDSRYLRVDRSFNIKIR